jgi:hypothetical protein
MRGSSYVHKKKIPKNHPFKKQLEKSTHEQESRGKRGDGKCKKGGKRHKKKRGKIGKSRERGWNKKGMRKIQSVK